MFNRCHEESPLIHPVGWARKVGHQVVASQEYFERCAMDNYLTTDCTPDMFPEYRPPPGNFVVGMKLEAVDPLNLAAVCVATVMKVIVVCSETVLLVFPQPLSPENVTLCDF